MSQFDDIGSPVVVASHPRSGTHLTIDLLRRQFDDCASRKLPFQRLDRLYLPLGALNAEGVGAISEQTATQTLRKSRRPIIKTHEASGLHRLKSKYPHWREWINQNATVLYIVRDCRAVMCSMHLYEQSFNPKSRGTLGEFIRGTRHGGSRIKRWAGHIEGWLSRPNVHPIRFEDLIQDTPTVLAEMSKILRVEASMRMPLLPKSIRGLWHGRWQRLTAVNPESSAIVGYYKGQRTKDWRTAYNREDLDFIRSEAEPILERLGYLDGYRAS